MIRLTLSKKVAHNVAKEKMTVGMMQALLDMYEKSFANNKVYLMKKLFNLRMLRLVRWSSNLTTLISW